MALSDSPISQRSAKNYNRHTFLILGGCFTLLVCSICFAALGAIGYVYYQESSQPEVAVVETERAEIVPFVKETAVPPTPTLEPPYQEDTAVLETPTPLLATALALQTVAAATPPPFIDIGAPTTLNQQPVPARAYADLERLIYADYPSNNPYELGLRLGKYTLGDRVIPGSKYEIGDIESFYNGEAIIEAVLLAQTDHANFWAETSLNLDQTAVAEVAQTFEDQYYETTVNLFGDYWRPGVDADPRFSVLHIEASADGELGYFSDTDEYPQTLFDTSNEQEIIYLSLENINLGDELYYGTLVHEFQHMIQWHVDPSEERWLNEGFSQLAELINLLDTVNTSDYLVSTETPLNRWSFEDEDATFIHYASSYLFMVYFWEQLGIEATQALSRHPANGMASVQQVLAQYEPELSLTQFVGNWAAANYLDDQAAGKPFTYQSLDFKKPSFAETADALPVSFVKHLEQFGVHYIDLRELEGPVQIKFAGDTIQEISNPPASGEQMWFAPGKDELNAQLTAVFDLTGLNKATLNYKIWYELEPDYDFAYISVSTNGGQTWDILSTDVTVNAEYGQAYNGNSIDNTETGWLDQSIRLDAYTGNMVMVRFEVISDFGITERGIAIDDISIPELNNYFLDVEGDTTGWQASGFVQIGHILPQLWSILLIEDGPQPTVTAVPLDAYNQGMLTTELDKDSGVLVIVPTTPFAHDTASYWVEISEP